MTTYARIISWHRVRFMSRGSQYWTRCGKWAPTNSPVSDTIPLDEKTCETCLRLTLRDEEIDDQVIGGVVET